MFSGDVGWDAYEEINVVTPGVNLGWPCYEATTAAAVRRVRAVRALLPPPGGTTLDIRCGPCRGQLGHRGRRLHRRRASTPPNGYRAALQNTYWFGDYSQQHDQRAQGGRSNNLVPGSVQQFSSAADGPVQLETGPDGDIYYLAILTGSSAASVSSGMISRRLP